MTKDPRRTFEATAVSGLCGPDFGEVSAEAVYHTFVLTLRPSGRSAYAGDHMPETHPPLVPEPPAPDTARRPLAEEEPESEKVDRRTAVWHAVQRPFQAFDRPRIRETAISAMIVVILAIGVQPEADLAKALDNEDQITDAPTRCGPFPGAIE